MKIKVQLHEGDKITTKIWRYEASKRRQYSKQRVEREMGDLYPQVVAKGLVFKVWHIDDLAGKIDIQSDSDMVEALENFFHGRQRPEFSTLHLEDCLKSSKLPSVESTQEKNTTTSKTRKVRFPVCILC